MSFSTPISHTVLAMDQSSQPTIILTTAMPQEPRPLRRRISHQSTPTFSSFLRPPSGTGGGSFISSIIYVINKIR
jgi:hypothetical protein